jgi:hypothetical protein
MALLKVSTTFLLFKKKSPHNFTFNPYLLAAGVEYRLSDLNGVPLAAIDVNTDSVNDGDDGVPVLLLRAEVEAASVRQKERSK